MTRILVIQDDGAVRASLLELLEELRAGIALSVADRGRWEQQGQGLGPAITRRLAELHGGELAIQSLPGQQMRRMQVERDGTT